MQLFVRGSETHALQLAGNETVSDIKDEYELTKLNDLSTLDIEVRMLGGKVHGSLARAGKVKGQTPKVEKQEKKKQKTGRAKRRMQYNRRFGVVVSTFGRRKGPNANS
uniref:40S ribosomal protein S30 n=1 Tax=Magallana gigas TaxID=29159 RepID=A0A8W8MMU5_MAGGI